MATKPPAGAIAIYARYSSELQNPRSTDDQVADLRESMARDGLPAADALVFTDAETSGTVLPEERPGMAALLRAIEAGRVGQVYVEHPDRLSRDLGDADRLAKLLLHHDVRLVCSNGIVLDGSAGASLSFGVTAVLSENYLRELGTKTRRGLRGNAREGKSTGGALYGYRTAEGARIEIDPEQAKVVRRIFALYLRGLGYSTVAAELNRLGIEPPRMRKRKAGDGWMHSCVREMLRNPKYVGEWSFGVREFRKNPRTRKRQARLRDESNVLRSTRPELAIIDRATWDTVQALLREQAEEYKRRNNGTALHRRTAHLLTGLLRCEDCGALMQLAGGSSDRYYRCSANRKRGTCTNRLSVRESVALARIRSAIGEAFWNPGALEHIRQQIASRLGDLSRELGAELSDRRARLKRHEERIRGIIAMQLDGDRSPYLAEMRRDFEAQAGAERAAVAELEARAEAPIELPRPSVIEERILGLDRLFDAQGDDVEPARHRLRRIFKDGTITLAPDGDAYVARTDLLPLEFMSAETEQPAGEGGLCPRVVARGRNYTWASTVVVPVAVRLSA